MAKPSFADHNPGDRSRKLTSRFIGKRIKAKIQTHGNAVVRLFWQCSEAIKALSKHLWRGEINEKRQIVLRRNWIWALSRCWTHFLTISTTTTLAYLNIYGYFIGENLQGLTGEPFQALYMLALQVLAKILELLMVASLGTIFLDVLRRDLLYGSNGLPLGLLSSKPRFVELQYLLSPEFRFGLAGFPGLRKRWLFGMFILTSTLISLFAGPSAALLMIPRQRSKWPAGGAWAWLTGDEDVLWPSRLTRSSIGGPHCENPDAQTLRTPSLNHSGCIWAGSSSLAQAFKQVHLSGIESLTIDDGTLNRQFVLHPTGMMDESWVMANHMAVGFLSKALAGAWWQSVAGTSRSSKHYTLRWRARNKTMGFIESWAPAVRTSCWPMEHVSRTDSRMPQYPFLPEYDVRMDLKYIIPTNTSFQTNISAQWETVPDIARLSNDSTTTDLPSAFLSVLLGGFNTTNNGTFFGCSIDARWTKATYSGGPVGFGSVNYVQRATPTSLRPNKPYMVGHRYGYLPKPDGSWRRIRIDASWLNALTPSLSKSNPNYNTVTTLLTELGIDSSTGLVNNASLSIGTLERVVGTLVADGLSRQGYGTNGGALSHITDPIDMLPWSNSHSSQESILSGNYKFPRPATGPATMLRWTVTVFGYAYSADSVAYYLALTVLFVHTAIVSAHVVYVLRKRVFCDAWDSFINQIVLTAVSGKNTQSGPSAVFEDAGSGMRCYSKFATEVRIRSSRARSTQQEGGGGDSATTGVERNVNILFGKDSGNVAAQGFEELKVNRVYG